MIDINELRPAVEAAGLNAISMQEVLELLDRLEAAESVLKDFGTTAQEVECWLERYRCIEREAEALRTRLEAAEADALEQARLNGMGGEREAALMAKLEAAEKERDALRAKIAEMEKQEPVAWIGRGPRDGQIEFSAHRPAPSVMRDFGMKPLYLVPGAQPAPSIPEGIQRVASDFYWDRTTLHHVPFVRVEFQPVAADAPDDAKGWQDRDRFFDAMLEATREAKP